MREIATTGRLVDGSLEGGNDLGLVGDGADGLRAVFFDPDLGSVFVRHGFRFCCTRVREGRRRLGEVSVIVGEEEWDETRGLDELRVLARKKYRWSMIEKQRRDDAVIMAI